jgi:hypothetical protein
MRTDADWGENKRDQSSYFFFFLNKSNQVFSIYYFQVPPLGILKNK